MAATKREKSNEKEESPKSIKKVHGVERNAEFQSHERLEIRLLVTRKRLVLEGTAFLFCLTINGVSE
jgi:hypothetical protein